MARTKSVLSSELVQYYLPDRDLPKYKELTAEKRPKPCFYDLSQDAQQRPTFDTKGSLPCLRRGTALWHDPTRRYVTPIELGAVMGFPTFQAGAENARVPLDVCRDMYGMGELGNTMCELCGCHPRHCACMRRANLIFHDGGDLGQKGRRLSYRHTHCY